jgi:hypothetical protein
MSTPHHCNACSVYIYDVLNCDLSDQDIYYGFYNFKAVKRILPELVREFQKIASDHCYDVFDTPDPRRSMYIAIRIIEEGLVKRTGMTFHGSLSRGRPHLMAFHWVNQNFRRLEGLQQIHREHSGGIFKEPEQKLDLQTLLRYLNAGHISPEKMEMYLNEYDVYSKDGSKYCSITSHHGKEDR